MSFFFNFPSSKARAPKLGRQCLRRAFSLIEVVFALGVFSFSMLTIVGLLATGLHSASDSSRNTALANIQRLLRANVAATSYSSVTSAGTTATYFTAAGYPTVVNPVSTVDNPYYTLTYTTTAPTGMVSAVKGEVVTATVRYPYPSNASTNTFSLFIAQ